MYPFFMRNECFASFLDLQDNLSRLFRFIDLLISNFQVEPSLTQTNMTQGASYSLIFILISILVLTLERTFFLKTLEELLE